MRYLFLNNNKMIKNAMAMIGLKLLLSESVCVFLIDRNHTLGNLARAPHRDVKGVKYHLSSNWTYMSHQ